MKESEFFGKTALVTGDTGFKGSWLCLWLQKMGCRVVGVSLPTRSIDIHYAALKLDVEHYDIDIRDGQKIQAVFSKSKPDFVFHLAAQAIVRQSYDDPVETFSTNVAGSQNILEAVRHTDSVRSFIYVTSDKCYKNKEWIWGYRENDELGGNDPYSASKAAAEILYHSYVESYFNKMPHLGVGTVRAGNVIGGGDFAKDRIVPDFVKSAREGETLVLRNPSATRPWQHVLEPVGGYLKLAANLYRNPKQFSGAWNFGPNVESNKTVLELVQALQRSWGRDVNVQVEGSHLKEASLLNLNCDKAAYALGWHPIWNFEQTVTETALWYRSYADQRAVAEVSHAQVDRYSDVLGNL